MKEKQYIYYFRPPFLNTIDVRIITKNQLDFLLELMRYSEFANDINYKTAKKLLKDHFPELLI